MRRRTDDGWTVADELRLNHLLRARLRQEVARARAATANAAASVRALEQALGRREMQSRCRADAEQMQSRCRADAEQMQRGRIRLFTPE